MYIKHESPLDDNEEGPDTTVSLIEERLEPRTKLKMEEATIVKEPIKETKHADVNLTHEEWIREKTSLRTANDR